MVIRFPFIVQVSESWGRPSGPSRTRAAPCGPIDLLSHATDHGDFYSNQTPDRRAAIVPIARDAREGGVEDEYCGAARAGGVE